MTDQPSTSDEAREDSRLHGHAMKKPPPRPAPPFMVQAYRLGQQTCWFTDCTTDSLAEAILAAQALHTVWGRVIRIIDQNEVVHLRLGTTTQNTRKTRIAARGPSDIK